MPTFYNDVDGKLEAVIENLLTTQAATTGSNIASIMDDKRFEFPNHIGTWQRSGAWYHDKEDKK